MMPRPDTTERFRLRTGTRSGGLRMSGFTLIEVLMVIVVVSILIGIVIPSSRPALNEQLKATAQILRAELMMTQSEAVAMGESRSAVVDPTNNLVFFEIESGGNYRDSLKKKTVTALSSIGADSSLLSSAKNFGEGTLITIDELPHHGVPALILGATSAANPNIEQSFITYGTLGELTLGSDLTIWLGISNAHQELYLPVTVNATTGITTIGSICTSGLPSCLSKYAGQEE